MILCAFVVSGYVEIADKILINIIIMIPLIRNYPLALTQYYGGRSGYARLPPQHNRMNMIYYRVRGWNNLYKENSKA